MIPRLKGLYTQKIVPNLCTKFAFKNKNMAPKVEKVVLNMGLGIDGNDKNKLKNCIEDMSLISGQMPDVTKFKKSISNFKTRKGTSAGVKVTLRKYRMYEFLDRLVNIALPRIKDFRGLKDTGFDDFGNYSFGLKEHIVFPEINFDKVERIRGMDITIVTSGKNKSETLALLKEFDFPFMPGKTSENKKNKISENKERKN